MRIGKCVKYVFPWLSVTVMDIVWFPIATVAFDKGLCTKVLEPQLSLKVM
jgi:hypothetical protein